VFPEQFGGILDYLVNNRISPHQIVVQNFGILLNKHCKAVTTGHSFNNNFISIFWNLDL